MTAIATVRLREVLDSRGDRTVEADVTTESGGFGRAAAPSGASTGEHEAVEIPADEAVAAAREHAVPRLTGVETTDQRAVDEAIHAADGTDDFSGLGANAAVALSMAAAKAGGADLQVPTYQHLGGAFRGAEFPIPLGNVLGGGEHATEATDIQEYLAVPLGAPSIRAAAFANAAVHRAVADVLAERGVAAGKGDEGAWAPPIADDTAFAVVEEAIDRVETEVGFEIGLGLDVAASELWDADGGVYRYRDAERTPAEQLEYAAGLVDEHGLAYVEDPLEEEDFEGFSSLTDRVGDRTLVCGDDLFATNAERLRQGIDEDAANAILVKPNQIGTLSDAVDAVELGVENGYAPVVSHRSGETEDATIAHLAVATGAPFVKTGVVGGERTAKLNELIRIEDNAL